jgi:hypothetical protein
VAKYGIFTVGDSITQAQLNGVASAVNGSRFRVKWASIETSPGVYNFNAVRASVDVCVNSGKYVWLQFLCSPCTDPNLANYNCPAYLFSSPYNVPKVYTTTSGTNLFYPHYVNANFQTRHRAFLDAVFAWVASLPTATKQKIILFLSSEGKTGDPGPYNGTPTNPAYVISNTDWNAYKYSLWTYQTGKISTYSLTDLHFMINPGNDGENLQYGLDNFTAVNFKDGDFTHSFDFNGSRNLTNRFLTFRDPSSFGDFLQILGGEFENTDEATYYTTDPKRYLLPFVCFNLAAGTSIITIAPAKMIADHYAYDLFNEFAQFRNLSEADRGLILFRDRPDFDDTIRFDEATYGPVIDPARLAGANGYTQKYNSIINSTKPDALKDDNITSLRISYFNAAREAAIVAAFPGASHISTTTNRDYDVRNENFGFDVIKGNFERYVSMYDPTGTSVGAWNIGPAGFDGLYTRKLTTALGKWYFSTPLLEKANYQATFKIKYYNAGAGQWALYYHNGTSKVNAGTVATTNTNEWIEKIYTIADFQGGLYLSIPSTTSKADFTIEKISGDDIYFSMLRFYRGSANTSSGVNTPPVANAGPDATYDAPIDSFTLSGSATDVDGDETILGCNWTQTGGPACLIATPFSFTTIVTGVGGSTVAPGIYYFTIKSIDNQGAQGLDQVVITVNPEVIVVPVPPSAVVTGPLTCNINETVNFDSSGSFDNDGTIVSRLWSVDGPLGWTIDDDTAEIINFIPIYTGDYLITVLITDNDGLTDELTVALTVIDPLITANTNGGLPGKKFQYYLINSNGISYYIENGVLKTSSSPKPLAYTPDGWQDLLIKWERNGKYHGINRNVTNQLSFVVDGAKIIRNLFWNGNALTKIFLLIQKRTLEIDDINFGFVYRFLYKGQLDLSSFQQVDISDGKKVKVNIAEGDFSKYLKAFENQTFEIDCSANATNAVPIWNDGVQYYNKINFTLPDFYDEINYTYTLPLTFINEEGDSFLLYKTSQSYEVIGTHFQDYTEHADYCAASGNFFFSYPKAVTFRLQGTLRFINTDSHTIQTACTLETSLGNKYTLHRDNDVATQNIAAGVTLERDIDLTIDLAANEKLFLILDHIYNVGPSSAGGKLSVVSDDLNIQVQTRLDPSLHYGRRLTDVLQELTENIADGTYTTSSELFEQFNSFVLTSGDAIRGFENAKLKISINDLFSFANAILAGGLSYNLKNVEIESRANYFDNSNPISLGIVKNVKFTKAVDRCFKSLKIGYENQSYETVNGRQEFNTTSQYTTPDTDAADLDMISSIRADAYGIESYRVKFFQKDTTDSKSDNDTFVIDVEDEPQDDGYYHLYRDTDATITGINSPETAYNTRLSPRNAIERNGALFRSMFWNMEDQFLTFQTSDKNQLLNVTKDGVSVIENEDIKASRLAAPAFIPIIAEIDPAGLWNLVDLLTANPNRCFTFDLETEGNTFEGYNLSVGMSVNDRNNQTFRLLLTTNNNVQNLI